MTQRLSASCDAVCMRRTSTHLHYVPDHLGRLARGHQCRMAAFALCSFVHVVSTAPWRCDGDRPIPGGVCCEPSHANAVSGQDKTAS